MWQGAVYDRTTGKMVTGVCGLDPGRHGFKDVLHWLGNEANARGDRLGRPWPPWAMPRFWRSFGTDVVYTITQIQH